MELNKFTEFKRCPNCGSENRFGESLAKELKDKGWAGDDFTYCLGIYTTPVVDKRFDSKIPIGSSVPVMIVHTDTCTDCGTIYAVRIGRSEAKKSLAPAQPMPNRMQRRHNGNNLLFRGKDQS